MSVLRLLFTLSLALPACCSDWRNIRLGSVIPDESYADQPYVVLTNDGNWLCVLTTGKGVEGQPGQHIVSMISKDKGRTWSPSVDIEPAAGPEASWVMPLKVPSGRVYVFYTYNKDNLRQVTGNNPRIARRVDTLGVYAFKYSDDNGRTWSPRRYEIPMRRMRIDRENYYHGEVMFFWGVGKPIITSRNYAIFGFAKVGRWGDPGAMIESQGCFLRSDNILTERDPEKIRFTLLPDGDQGLRAPHGPVSDEANLAELSDGTLYATYRTIDGYNCQAYSHDGGHHWTGPEYATYSPGGRRIKHPRAANFVRKFSNGKFLLWFHNQGGDAAITPEWTSGAYYRNRNPGWILGGVERNGKIYWSQPEILLYDEDPNIRISYPDFIEDHGRFFITETQKEVARTHEIDKSLLDAVWNTSTRSVTRAGLAFEAAPGANPKMPVLAGSFSIDFWMNLKELTAGQILFDSRDAQGKGILVTTADRFNLRITLNDGKEQASWDSDYGTQEGTLRTGAWQHIAIIVDGGPRIISYVIDGQFNDGGPVRQFGWGRFPATLGDFNGAASAQIAPRITGELRSLRFYTRYLLTAEAVGNYQAGLPRMTASRISHPAGTKTVEP
ncbi:MAG: exo-alpha-sialidase [Bryobacterales bacterium]|nr:exo-alpha-sialidase [Bryobacterales bacterium]